jgi:hypothetical protein
MAELQRAKALDGNAVTLRTQHTLPTEERFAPSQVSISGAEFLYDVPFLVANGKPQCIFIPPLSHTWSQFDPGFDLNAQVDLVDKTKGIALCSIRITPRLPLGQIWLNLESDPRVNWLSETADPALERWHITSPEVGREYRFQVKFTSKDSPGRAPTLNPPVAIGARLALASEKREQGKSVATDVAGLGSLVFRAGQPGMLELVRHDQIMIYLWSSSGGIDLAAPLIGWGVSGKVEGDRGQGLVPPATGSLLVSPECSQVSFWAGVAHGAFAGPIAAEVEWVDPTGRLVRTGKPTLVPGSVGGVTDVLPLTGPDAMKLGTWHVRLRVNQELLLDQFFLVSTLEETVKDSFALKPGAPHFQVGGSPFAFVGGFVVDAGDLAGTADMLTATARLSGLTVLSLMLPYSREYADEASLRQLDMFLDRASANGVRVIVTLLHGLSAALEETNPFYPGIEGLVHDPALRSGYKELVTRVVTRVNTVNGVRYSDDPTIMAWDLLSEPIPTGVLVPKQPKVTTRDFGAWITEMASHVRSLDPNHLVTMMLTGQIAGRRDWPEAMGGLDFLFMDICLYDILYVDRQPLTKGFVERYMNYPLFSLGKPVVAQFAYTSAWLTEEFATNHQLQASIFTQALEKGFEDGLAGALVFCWGTKRKEPTKAESHLTYNATNEHIVSALLKGSAGLGSGSGSDGAGKAGFVEIGR